MLELVGIARNKKFFRHHVLATQEDQRAEGHDTIGLPVGAIAGVLRRQQIASGSTCASGIALAWGVSTVFRIFLRVVRSPCFRLLRQNLHYYSSNPAAICSGATICSRGTRFFLLSRFILLGKAQRFSARPSRFSCGACRSICAIRVTLTRGICERQNEEQKNK